MSGSLYPNFYQSLDVGHSRKDRTLREGADFEGADSWARNPSMKGDLGDIYPCLPQIHSQGKSQGNCKLQNKGFNEGTLANPNSVALWWTCIGTVKE